MGLSESFERGSADQTRKKSEKFQAVEPLLLAWRRHGQGVKSTTWNVTYVEGYYFASKVLVREMVASVGAEAVSPTTQTTEFCQQPVTDEDPRPWVTSLPQLTA